MRKILLLTSFVSGLVFLSSAQAADSRLQEKPANEYCFVWVGGPDGGFVDRKEVRFVLDGRNSATRRVNKKLSVDQFVDARILGDSAGYRLSIFKKGLESRPLGTGYYMRSGIIEDWNTTGFDINTDDASYAIACVTESYL